MYKRQAKGELPKWWLDPTFRLDVHDLSHLEDVLADDTILHMWELQCKCETAGANRVSMSAERCREINEPAKVPRRGDDCDEDEEDAPGGGLGKNDSDVEWNDDDKNVVDTDVDSAVSDVDSLASSLESDECATEKYKSLKPPTAPASISKLVDRDAATGAKRSGLKPMWSDEYFSICLLYTSPSPRD